MDIFLDFLVYSISFYLYTSTTLFYHVFWCLGGKLFCFVTLFFWLFLAFFGFHMIYIFPLVLLRYNCYTSLHMFKVYNMVVWLSTSWDVDDFDRPCNEMLPSYLWQQVHFSSLSPFWSSGFQHPSCHQMAICSWVSHLPSLDFTFLSFRSALPTSRGCWADQMR